MHWEMKVDIICVSVPIASLWSLQFHTPDEYFWLLSQIWGEVKQGKTELAQARLGLVFITQFLLKILLEEKLGIMAPLDL